MKLENLNIVVICYGRSPQGERGLKHETIAPGTFARVAPRKGSVG